MIDVVVNIIVVLYGFSIIFVLFHSFFDAHLIFHYLRSAKKSETILQGGDHFPFVTIQLPVYNELHVIERLLETVACIDYPRNRMEIQVLDDSTDETTQLVSQKIQQLLSRHVPIQHIQRTSREGYKAGALKHGLAIARGEFIAVFDADFLPAKNFLLRTIPHFNNENIGMVQTKWGHINKDESLLARLQAMALDGHFTIEQQGRNAGGYFINFNGTAGVWRKQAILDAGNWQADTLTEDFDLSYRAQMRGWKFVYLENLITPAELPPLVSALKSQQFRWTKGGAETARKNLKKLFTSNVSPGAKLHGAFHLVYSFGFISIILYALLTVPMLFIKESYPQYAFLFKISGLLAISFCIYILHYFISYANTTTGSVARKAVGFIIHFPLFVSLFIGLSLSNAIGIIQGYLGFKSPFIRTPKFNAIKNKTKALKSKYANTNLQAPNNC